MGEVAAWMNQCSFVFWSTPDEAAKWYILSIIQGGLNKRMIIFCIATPLSAPVKFRRINFSDCVEKWATDFDLQGFIIILQQNQD